MKNYILSLLYYIIIIIYCTYVYVYRVCMYVCIYEIWSSLFFLKKIFFLLWTIFKVFIEFITTLLLFSCFVFFGHEAYGVLAPWLGIEPTPASLDGKVFTTRPPGKSLLPLFWCELHSFKLYIFLPPLSVWLQIHFAQLFLFTCETIPVWRREVYSDQIL